MATQSYSNKNIAAGDQTEAALEISNNYVTMQVTYANVIKQATVKLEQSLDNINWSDISFPGTKEMALNIRGTGSQTLNMIGLYCTHIRVRILQGESDNTGLISKIALYY